MKKVEGINKVLVTGGAGFIGSALTVKLNELGYHVTVIDNLMRGNKIPKETLDQINFVEGDIRDSELVDSLVKGCDVVFHMAAILGVDVVADNPVETMDVEAIGMMNLTKSCIAHGVKKILYASTSGIYGHSSMEKAVDEEIMVDPRTSYAMAKRFNEIYLSSVNDEKGLNAICLRFFNVFGSHQDNRMVIPRFFQQAIKGEDITVFGSGDQTRDFTHIDDTVKACLLLMEKVDGFEIFNIANENERSIGDLAKIIKELTNSDSKIAYLDAPKKRYDYEVERRVGSSEKLLKHVGFKPTINLEDGLKDIYKEVYL